MQPTADHDYANTNNNNNNDHNNDHDHHFRPRGVWALSCGLGKSVYTNSVRVLFDTAKQRLQLQPV
jgi:hypothetical protein